MRGVLSTLAFVSLVTAAQAQNLSADDLVRRNIERRAVEAVIWGMPAVNTDLILQEMLTKTSGKVNQIIYWGRPVDWRNQTLTRNSGCHLYHGVLQHQRCRPDRVRYILDDRVRDQFGSEAATVFG
jgi:hypothetical protein